jgi:hypothetical protein
MKYTNTASKIFFLSFNFLPIHSVYSEVGVVTENILLILFYRLV